MQLNSRPRQPQTSSPGKWSVMTFPNRTQTGNFTTFSSKPIEFTTIKQTAALELKMEYIHSACLK